MFEYNKDFRSSYRISPSYCFTLSMCVLGFAKVPFLIYKVCNQFYYDYDQIYNFNDVSFSNSSIQLLIGIVGSLLFLMAFSYKISRKLMIFLSEGSFIAYLVLYHQNTQYYPYAAGFTLPISSVIFPLVLNEISYDPDYFNLANYLQLSYIFSFIYFQLQFDSNTTFIILICISSFSLIICFCSIIDETTIYWYMKGHQQKAEQIIQHMHCENHDLIKSRFRQKTMLISQQARQPSINTKKKDFKVLILSFLIPQTFVFNYLEVVQHDNLIYVYIIVASFIAHLLLQLIGHSFLQKLGLMVSLYLFIIAYIEYKINSIENNLLMSYIYFFILNYLVVSVWLVKSFQRIRIRFIWLQQLLFWISLYLSCYSYTNEGYFTIQGERYPVQIIQLSLSCLIGYLIVCNE